MDATLEADAEISRIATRLGTAIRDERRRRGMTLQELAGLARVAISSVQKVESGGRGSLEMYTRLASGLDRTLDITLAEPVLEPTGLAAIGDGPPMGRFVGADAADIVHAAMGEREVTVLGRHALRCAVDEPWQHYRFAGRADVLSWDPPERALLHLENRTQYPDIQDSVGSFNNKRAYLGDALWQRLGMRGPPLVETHVMVALWSSEVIEALRAHPGTFRAVCPDPIDPFLGWWSGRPPRKGVTCSLVLFDPFATGSQPPFATLKDALNGARPRITGYAAAAALVRAGRGR